MPRQLRIEYPGHGADFFQFWQGQTAGLSADAAARRRCRKNWTSRAGGRETWPHAASLKIKTEPDEQNEFKLV
jgi:hypothetical protein